MTIKAGYKVKFADCAKHLKSYDKGAVGVVERKAIYGGCEEKNNVKVKFTYPDGRELTLPSIGKSNLTRYRGSEYEAVKTKEAADKDGWIKWEGGECPVERGVLVDVVCHEGNEISSYESSDLIWKHGLAGVDNIIGYRLHSPAADNTENAQQENTMTTLHDWVHELESINTRGQELRELIADEVAKCGGSVEWGGDVREAESSEQMDWRDLKEGDRIVIDEPSTYDSDYTSAGNKHEVTCIEAEDYKGFANVEIDGTYWIGADITTWRKVR